MGVTCCKKTNVGVGSRKVKPIKKPNKSNPTTNVPAQEKVALAIGNPLLDAKTTIPESFTTKAQE